MGLLELHFHAIWSTGHAVRPVCRWEMLGRLRAMVNVASDMVVATVLDRA